MAGKTKYIVVSRENLLKVLVGNVPKGYIEFDYYTQAETWRKGIKLSHPETEYCIVEHVLSHYEQVSGFTDEPENSYDYT